MRFRIVFPFAVFLALLSLPALSWGPAGHEAIGSAAARWLSTQHYTRAQQEVQRLLRPGESLASVSTWADQIKYGSPFPGDPESERFLSDTRNLLPTVEDGKARHFGFHYTDRPFQAAAYEPFGTGARPDDIVGTLNACIESLRNAGAGKQRFEPRVALMLLVHLAGDIHQPLHVGCGYIAKKADGSWGFVYPDSRNRAVCDEGGNKISFLVNGKKMRLHRYWDDNAVSQAMGRRSPAQFAAALASHTPDPAWRARGPLGTWCRAWASDTIGASREMYAPVRIESASGEGARQEWTVAFESGYQSYSEMSGRLAERQLAKAGFRLAELLHAIWP